MSTRTAERAPEEGAATLLNEWDWPHRQRSNSEHRRYGASAPVSTDADRTGLSGHPGTEPYEKSSGDCVHWSPTSQPFAHADVLFQYLRDGWQLNQRVVIQRFELKSRRKVLLYRFSVANDEEHLIIPILDNPVIRGFVQSANLSLCPKRDMNG